MKKHLLLFSFILTSYCQTIAQVNTEIYRPSNRQQGLVGQLKASLSLNRGNGNNDIFSGSIKNSYVRKRHVIFGIGSYNFGQTRNDGSTNVFKRKGFLYAKYNYAIDKDSASHWSAEVFGQNELNEFIRLQNRLLGGIGFRWDIIKNPKALNLSFGSSVMYEFEEIKLDSSDLTYPLQTNFWRWSNYLSMTYLLDNSSNKTFFSFVAYIQPAVYDINNSQMFNLTENYRILLNASVRTNISKTLSFGMTFKYRHASFIQSFLENYDYSLRSNLIINF
ncbi:DUF481 domain-containing protein [Microscilla marina]|uniref:DUF481 domain-containing protein n=1 Tax=Microscilla marina ATCC 23134 TaxID=313606 RepID=A1ZUU1_MICM2|nr:DUF481 domain-containing protein [Microscilla marina]EAY25845.1 hypothetical protein M23134_07657 [Microscilla marina ATCC 23134]